MKQRGELKRTPLERSTTPLRRRRRATAGTADQREHFKHTTCFGHSCAVTDDGACEGPLQAHHVIPQEKIKAFARAAGVALAALLWDTRNGLAVCRRHHDRHTLATRRIPLSALQPRHRVFARELHLEHLLERTYRETDERSVTAC